MKKEILLVLVLAIVILGLGAVLMWPKPKVQNNNPPEVKGLQVDLPKENQEISSPLKITGATNGEGWNGFEGQVGTVKLLDYKGNELGMAILTATTDWMQPPVSFEANLTYSASNEGPGTLVFYNENPSGMPDKEKTFSLPVKIKASGEISTVKVFFGNLALSASSETDECKRVYSVNKSVAKTQAVAEAAINELLKGPTDAEKSQGYYSSIPAGSKLNSIKIENGTAFVDFNAATESGGGSCSMAARVAQITQTLLQFSTIKSVKLSVDGRTGDIFQP